MVTRPCLYPLGGGVSEGTFLRFAEDTVKDDGGNLFQKTWALVETSKGQIVKVEPTKITFTDKGTSTH